MNDNNNTESVLYAVGTRGYSAYEVAVQNGFVGTEQEWLDSLVGPPGPQGQPFDTLTPEQKEEIRGPEGKSAYEVAVDEGYEGTEEDFVNSYINADNYYNKSEIDSALEERDTEISQIDFDLSTSKNKIESLENSTEAMSARMDSFTTLEEGSTTGDAELIDARTGVDGFTYTNAGGAIRENDKISQNILSRNDMYLYESLHRYKGYPMQNNTWGNINSTYNIAFIAVKPGDFYYIKVSQDSNVPVFGFITDLTIPTITNGASINYVSGTTRQTINKTINGIVPETATFMFIQTKQTNEMIYDALLLNNHDYINPKTKNELTLSEMQESVNDNLATSNMIWIQGAFGTSIGRVPVYQTSNSRRASINYNKRNYKQYIVSDGTFKTKLLLCDSNYALTSAEQQYNLDVKEIPKDTYYKILICDATNDATNISSYTSEQINSHIKIISAKMYDLFNKFTINWCALGDSITQGFYSFIYDDVEPRSALAENKCWAKLVSIQNQWNLTNKGVGGQGFLHTLGVTKGYEFIDTIDFIDYNLVTLAYGINDWKGNQVLGTVNDSSENPTTVCGAMKHSIEHILYSNPKLKLIVVLPFNCIGYNFNYGDKSTNYALGYRFTNSGTLEEFVQKMIEVCNYYGIEYIDTTHYSCINRETLRALLPDGVHPSLDCHKLIAEELSRRI